MFCTCDLSIIIQNGRQIEKLHILNENTKVAPGDNNSTTIGATSN